MKLHKNKESFKNVAIFDFCCTLLMGEISIRPRKGGEYMKRNIDEINKFDSCIKKGLTLELKYRLRSMKNHQKHYINISGLSYSEMSKLTYNDKYPSDIFREKLTTRLFETVIHDELLYDALLEMKPDIREIVLLKYWGDLSDLEIGQAMKMNRRIVNYNKNKALRELRKILEEMKRL